MYNKYDDGYFNVAPDKMIRVCSTIFNRISNIQFLSLTKIYSNNTFSIVANCHFKKWVKHFSQNYIHKDLLLSRLHLGINRWNDSSNLLLSQANKNAYDDFGLSEIKDVVKVSLNEVGCYDIYTFAIKHKQHCTLDHDIYRTHKSTMLQFISNIEKPTHWAIHQHNPALLVNRATIDTQAPLPKSFMDTWDNHYRHICNVLGHTTSV